MKKATSTTVPVSIHPSQFPESVRRDLLASLRARRVNHKFHYDSVKQTQKWLALHQVHSPSRHDQDCAATYDRAFAAAASQIPAARVHVLGLGCGGGQKDTRLLKLLQARGKAVLYTPSDVSVAMTLVARQTALQVVPAKDCFPYVCDLGTAHDLPAAFASSPATRASRLITFFGMIPNFEPQLILPKLAALTRRTDWLLFSANLAPGRDYAAGVRRILPQYDNALTRDWLGTFLYDLGVARNAGALKFEVETVAKLGLKRVVANFHFRRAQQITVEGETFAFRAGERIRLFFSYRYTPDRVQTTLARCGLKVCESWITQSEEEGVFLCRRK
jgi:L-histidine Nalpha-methyltransferase